MTCKIPIQWLAIFDKIHNSGPYRDLAEALFREILSKVGDHMPTARPERWGAAIQLKWSTPMGSLKVLVYGPTGMVEWEHKDDQISSTLGGTWPLSISPTMPSHLSEIFALEFRG